MEPERSQPAADSSGGIVRHSADHFQFEHHGVETAGSRIERDISDDFTRHSSDRFQVGRTVETAARRSLSHRTEKAAHRPGSAPEPGESTFSEEPGSLFQDARTLNRPEKAGTTRRMKQHDSKYAQLFGEDTQRSAAAGETKENGRKLQFTQEETPLNEVVADRKLTAQQNRVNRLSAKLHKAREKLPARHKLAVERSFDDTKGKSKIRLYFDKQTLPKGQQTPNMLQSQPKRLMWTGAEEIHGKIREVEHENVGVESAHKIEQGVENFARGRRSLGQRLRERPYRTVQRLERKTATQQAKLVYQQALQENPKLKGNVLSRYIQKQKIKRQYAKARRAAAKNGDKAVKVAGTAASKLATVVGDAIKHHPGVAAAIVLVLLLIIFIVAMFSSCSAISFGSLSSVAGSTYTAADKDIVDAESYYTQLEMDLQLQIDNVETDRPGYDEYRYYVDEIGHDPLALMAYLSACYEDFQFSDIQAILHEIFNEQYALSFDEETETRTRTEYFYDENNVLQSREVEYTYRILNTRLTSRPFDEVLALRLDAEQKERYDLFMESLGNRQYGNSPFAFPWVANISCPFGWRVHPITGAQDFHKAVDIAVPGGTPILAVQGGTVVTATFHASYGNYVVIENEQGLRSLYAHSSALLVHQGQTVEVGQPIALVGSTGDSTGNHLHLELYLNGELLNPIYFVDTGESAA